MSEFGRKVVVDADFETALGFVCQALRKEGLQVVARIDLRDHFWRHTGHTFGPYVLMHAWSPELALDALRQHGDVGTCVATAFAVYRQSDRQSVVVVKDPFWPMAEQAGWQSRAPELAAVADRERERVTRVLAQLQSPATVS